MSWDSLDARLSSFEICYGFPLPSAHPTFVREAEEDFMAASSRRPSATAISTAEEKRCARVPSLLPSLFDRRRSRNHLRQRERGSATVPPHPTATLCSDWIRRGVLKSIHTFCSNSVYGLCYKHRTVSTEIQKHRQHLFMGNFYLCVIEDRSNTHVHKYNSVTPSS